MLRTVFNQQPLFIPFIMAGHPDINTTIEALLTLTEAGADIIELGVPFSDPSADGAVNQRASEIALQNGVTLEQCLNIVKQVRDKGCKTAIILFSYLNPILSMGFKTLAQKASDAGVNGFLILDLPPEEGKEYYKILSDHNLEIVLLASPTTSEARLGLYEKVNPGFIYYISRLGVTGTQDNLANNLEQEVHNLYNKLPNSKIVVGFGISTPEQASQVAKFSDGVVIGSVLVKELENNGICGLKNLASQLHEAIVRKT